MIRVAPVIALCALAGCATLVGIEDYKGAGSSAGGQGGGVSWLAGYTHRRSVTIKKDDVDAPLEDFPVAVRLTELIAGEEIVVTDSDHSLLPVEIERSDSGGISFWFRAPLLRANFDNVFYIYYGRDGTPVTQPPLSKDVWSNGFVSVVHCGDKISADGGLLLNSVTGIAEVQAVNMETNDTQVPTAQFGYGCRFTADDEHLRLADPAASLDSLAFSIWARTSAFDTARLHTVFANSASGATTNGVRFFVDGESKELLFELADGSLGEAFRVGNNYVFPVNEFKHIGFGYRPDTNTIRTHHDSIVSNRMTVYDAQLSAPMFVGAMETGGIAWGASMTGSLAYVDEIRVSSKVRSANWISAVHRNLGDPRLFAGVGDEDDAP